jgi:hypothetical protein
VPLVNADIDYVEVQGTRSLVAAALPANTTSLLYVPTLNANGHDYFEYRATDCPGDDLRLSAPARIDIDIGNRSSPEWEPSDCPVRARPRIFRAF